MRRRGLQAGLIALETAFRNTAAKPGLGIRAAAEVAVATSGTTTHEKKVVAVKTVGRYGWSRTWIRSKDQEAKMEQNLDGTKETR
jgi:hypothetical protein